MNASTKFLALLGFVFALLVVYPVAPGTAILLGIALVAAAYVAVRSDRR